MLALNPLKVSQLLDAALHLPAEGLVVTTEHRWTYLDIDDDYIHRLFPLLAEEEGYIQKPEYFGENLAGAHITIMYPEENKFILSEDLGKTHSFSIRGAFYVDLGLKRYYVLEVESASLLALRAKYGLGPLLDFKNYLINLHITIGNVLLMKKSNNQ